MVTASAQIQVNERCSVLTTTRKFAAAIAAILLAVSCTDSVVQAQPDAPVSLIDSVEQGTILVESVSGTGSSSGTALNAVLVNTTAIAQRVLVHFDAPLFFRNRGIAQNMAATQVYERDGSYRRRDGGVPYLEVEAGSRLPVAFVAYCADFDKDNPSAMDTFDLAPLPPQIATVMRQISKYETSNPSVDTTAASQLALWVTQGHTLATIGERFEFDTNDEVVMDSILAVALD